VTERPPGAGARAVRNPRRGLNHGGVVRFGGAVANDDPVIFWRERFARHGADLHAVEIAGDGQYPGRDGDLLFGQLVGETGSIKALKLGADDFGGHLQIGQGHQQVFGLHDLFSIGVQLLRAHLANLR